MDAFIEPTNVLFEWVLSLYRLSLEWVLANPTLTLLVLLLTIGL